MKSLGKGDIDPIIDHLAGHFVWRFDAPPTIPFAGDYKTPRRSSPWVLWIGPVTIEKEHEYAPASHHHTPARVYMEVLVTFSGVFCVVRPNTQLNNRKLTDKELAFAHRYVDQE